MEFSNRFFACSFNVFWFVVASFVVTVCLLIVPANTLVWKVFLRTDMSISGVAPMVLFAEYVQQFG